MKINSLSITTHEAAEMLKESLRNKGVELETLVIEDYNQPRVIITYGAKTDSKGRLIHGFEMTREMFHYTYVD